MGSQFDLLEIDNQVKFIQMAIKVIGINIIMSGEN